MLHHRHGVQTNTESYRYAFQGQEKDDEIKGEGNSYNYEYRMHDPRIGRFFAVDPLAPKYPFYSPYAFSGNQVINMVELEGLEPGKPLKYIGQTGLRKESDGTITAWKVYGTSTGSMWWAQTGTITLVKMPDWIPGRSSEKTEDKSLNKLKVTNNNSVGFDYAKHGSYKYDGKDTEDECYKAVNRMIESMGFVPKGNDGWGSSMWFVTEKGKEDAERVAGTYHGVTLDIPKATAEMEKAYTALQNGIPVNLGVDYANTGTNNTDQVTDHFVLAIGYGYDEEKKQRYIQFVDVITEKKGIDESYNANPNNRLYEVSPGVWQGISNGGNSTKQWYTVTNVRIAKKKQTGG